MGDKACDELLNMAVGDDLFNRSIYIEDNLSASQNLQRFDKQQEDIWRKCQERKEKQEELKKQEREAEVLKQERIKLEIQAEKDALAAQKAELEARAKTEADELAKIASEK